MRHFLFQVVEMQRLLFLYSEFMNFYLCGAPIKHSISPLIHNTTFKQLKLDHEYYLAETLDIKVVTNLLHNTNTGGASVTIPHKESIIPFLDALSADAQKIKAVNTIVKKNNRLIGYNTDWIGIKNPIEATHKHFDAALIIGAGGAARAACYALNQLNIPFTIYNRTPEKAEKLADEFNGEICMDLNTHQSDLVITTIPPTATLALSEGFWAPTKAVFDIVYKPHFTPILTEAKIRNIKTIHGIEMLLEQAYEQFFLWTGVSASSEKIENVVKKFLGSR